MEKQTPNKSEIKNNNKIDISSGSVTGSININNDANRFDKNISNNSINTGGGVFIGGNVNTAGGDFVGRDKMTNNSEEEIAELFKKFYSKIETDSKLSELDKADLKEELIEIKKEISKKGEYADEHFLFRRLRNIQRITPDISEFIISSLTNPIYGFNNIFRKIAEKMVA